MTRQRTVREGKNLGRLELTIFHKPPEGKKPGRDVPGHNYLWAEVRNGGWNGRPFWEKTAGGSITIPVKNVFTAVSRVSGRICSLTRITAPYGLKSVRIRGENRRIIPCIRIFKGGLYDFSCAGLLVGTQEKGLISNTFVTQNGSTDFRFVR